MLSETALADYRRDGFVVLPDILTMAEVEALRRVTEQLVEGSRAVAANDEIYDLEDTHYFGRATGPAHQDTASASCRICPGCPPPKDRRAH